MAWEEIVWVKPRLDLPSAKKMEANLSGRFAKVAKGFGIGLKSIAKGALLGISISLLAKLLNPLQEIGDKIKELIGEGSDVRDLAERLGSDAGATARVQGVAASFGVKPEEFAETLRKFAEEMDTARRELRPDFEGERSQSTLALAQFAGEKDALKAFLAVVESLKGLKSGPRADFEKAIFGAVQFGGMKRLIDADIDDRAASLGPSASTLGSAVGKTSRLQDLQNFLETRTKQQHFVNAAGTMSEKQLRDFDENQRRENRKSLRQLESEAYESMKSAADGINAIKASLEKLQEWATKILGYLGQFVLFIDKLQKQWWFRNGGK